MGYKSINTMQSKDICMFMSEKKYELGFVTPKFRGEENSLKTLHSKDYSLGGGAQSSITKEREGQLDYS